jgi:hypothetical protein
MVLILAALAISAVVLFVSTQFATSEVVTRTGMPILRVNWTAILTQTLAPFLIAGLAIGIAIRRLAVLDRVHWMPAAEYCPACGHNLRGVSTESDGCTVCPECGAAWRVPRSAKDSDQSSKSSA